MHQPIHYADGTFDRAAEHRRDADWLARRLADRYSRVFVFWRGRTLVADDGRQRVAAPLTPADLPGLEASRSLLLGLDGDVACFAVDLSEQAEPPAFPGSLVELREVALTMPRRDAALLAYARGLFVWQANHRFCGLCGSPTVPEKAGHVLRCANPDCRRSHFPRSDPAVITLVWSGERCLLARRATWPVNRRSTIAGFVEPGETLEDAVRREILEEVGVPVGNVCYQSSQPWPFPTSLMLGFTAQAESETIRVDDDEISEADWYTRDELRRQAAAGSLLLPPEDSISRRLVVDWLDAG